MSKICGGCGGTEPEKPELQEVMFGCDSQAVLLSPPHLQCCRTGQASYSTNGKHVRRGALTSVSVLLVLFAWSFTLSGQGANRDARSVDAVPVISGAVLADRFDQQEVDRRIWHRPDWLEQHNPYIAVEPEHGWLHLSGVSRASGEQFQYVGLISSKFRETDVVLAARMRVRSAFYSTSSTCARVTGPISLLRWCSGRYGAGRQCGRAATSIAFLTTRGTWSIYSQSCRLPDAKRQSGTRL